MVFVDCGFRLNVYEYVLCSIYLLVLFGLNTGSIRSEVGAMWCLLFVHSYVYRCFFFLIKYGRC